MPRIRKDLPTGLQIQRLQTFPLSLFLSFLLLFTVCMNSANAAQAGKKTSTLPKVTKQLIQAQLEQLETATDLNDEMKAQLTDLYRKALSYLEAKSSYDESARTYRHARKTADQEARTLRKKMERVASKPPEKELRVSEKNPLPEIEQQLFTEKANLSAVEAKLTDIEQQLRAQQDRPATIQQRLVEAKKSQEQFANALSLPPSGSETGKLQNARRWLQQAKTLAVQAEIQMLDQELLSLPMRLDLLKAQRDYYQLNIERIGARVQILSRNWSTRNVVPRRKRPLPKRKKPSVKSKASTRSSSSMHSRMPSSARRSRTWPPNWIKFPPLTPT